MDGLFYWLTCVNEPREGTTVLWTVVRGRRKPDVVKRAARHDSSIPLCSTKSNKAIHYGWPFIG